MDLLVEQITWLHSPSQFSQRTGLKIKIKVQQGKCNGYSTGLQVIDGKFINVFSAVMTILDVCPPKTSMTMTMTMTVRTAVSDPSGVLNSDLKRFP